MIKATIKPYRPKTSAKIKIKIMPTYNLNGKELIRSEARETRDVQDEPYLGC